VIADVAVLVGEAFEQVKVSMRPVGAIRRGSNHAVLVPQRDAFPTELTADGS
jgi:hypothetical protein